MWGDAEHMERRAKEEERRIAIHDKQWELGSKLERLLRDAETDNEAYRLVELARLIDPQSFRSRDDMFEHVERMRSGPSGNDPAYQDIIATHQRVARLAIEPAINKAEAVLALVRSWG